MYLLLSISTLSVCASVYQVSSNSAFYRTVSYLNLIQYIIGVIFVYFSHSQCFFEKWYFIPIMYKYRVAIHDKSLSMKFDVWETAKFQRSINRPRLSYSDPQNNYISHRFNVQWLRFHCRCPKCHPEFSGQYLVDKELFSNSIRISTAVIEGTLTNILPCYV